MPVPSSNPLHHAEALLQQGDLSAAETAFAALLDQGFGGVEPLLALGVIKTRQGMMDEATAWFEKALQVDPNHLQSLYNLAIIHKTRQDHQGAIERFKEVVMLDPRHMAALNGLANSLSALGLTEQAETIFYNALAFDPLHGQTLYNLAVMLQNLGHSRRAFELYHQVLAQDPSNGAAWTNLGAISREMGDTVLARHALTQAVSSAPHKADAWVNLGLLYESEGDRQQAKECAKRAHGLEGHQDFPHYSLGLLFAKLGDKPKAQHHLTVCLNHDPSDTLGAGLILAALGLAPLPAKSSDAQMVALYHKRAGVWDQGVKTDFPYQGHLLVIERTRALYPTLNGLQVLDAGCGTGLVAEGLKPLFPDHLDGIDLSQPMVEKARAKGLYSTLITGDMVAYMASHPSTYDLVTSAATLIHFGDLTEVFAAACHTLRPAGRFIFTVFPAPPEQQQGAAISLHQGHAAGGCYLHAPSHLTSWAEAVGFEVEAAQEAVHEYHHGQPVMALVVSLIKS